MRTASRLVSFALSAVVFCFAAERFEVSYFHDEDDSSLQLAEILFPSEKRGLAIGVLSSDKRDRGVVLLTSDAGANWSTVSIDDIPVSLYCLDETACWLVGEKGIWFSEESGREWKKIRSESNLRRVWFTSRLRGFATGTEKKLIETRDGGKSWNKMEVAAKLQERSDRLTFWAISFFNPKVGIIVGRSEPVEMRENPPIWLSPEPQYRREHPTLSVSLETRDGGESWKVTEGSIFGRMSRIVVGKGYALTLVEFDRFFDYASEIYQANFSGAKSERMLRRKDIATTDIALMDDGRALAVGFEPLGKLARTPVPGKLRVLRSSPDLKVWEDIPVDYRAVARRVSIAVAGGKSVWLATDQGMILRLADN